MNNDIKNIPLSTICIKNRYTDNFPIGKGGMGIIKKSHDNNCHRTIALKTLLQSDREDSLVRFTEEAQITAQLEHPNIIPIYEIFTEEGQRISYSMKLVDGEDLKVILDKIKKGDQGYIDRFPLRKLLEIFIYICNAVSYANSKNVFHRDLKPANIMVGNRGKVYLVDWGLAKIQKPHNQSSKVDNTDAINKLNSLSSFRTEKDLDLSMEDIIMGTPNYMAPERFLQEADEKTEMYALGAILYNILTLQLTVFEETVELTVRKIFAGDIKDPSELNTAVPHIKGGKVPLPLAAIAMKSLSVDPDDRYENIKEMVNDIIAWEDGFVTKAENASFCYSLYKIIKRKKFESLAVLAFIICITCISIYYVQKLSIEKKRLEKSKKESDFQANIILNKQSQLKAHTKELESKIQDLREQAQHFYKNANSLIKSNEGNSIQLALEKIQPAIELEPLYEYLILQSLLFQTQLNFDKARKSLERINKSKTPSLVQEYINFSQNLKSSELSLMDLYRLKEFALSLKLPAIASTFLKVYSNKQDELYNKFIKSLNSKSLTNIEDKITKLNNITYSINLKNLHLKDTSFLKQIPFEKVNISYSQTKTISFLEGMPIKFFYCNNTNVSDLSPLKNNNLEYIEAINANLKNINSLDNSSIVKLDVHSNKLTHIPNINLPYLRFLYLSENEIQSIENINNFKNLHFLSLSSNKLSDISPLKELQLNFLNISHNKISDISPIKNHPLIELDISYTDVNDLTSLTTCNKLKKLNLQNTSITDLSPLIDLNIEELNLKNCIGVETLEQIVKIDSLRILHLPPNISNLQTLKDFKSLEYVYSPKNRSLLPVKVFLNSLRSK